VERKKREESERLEHICLEQPRACLPTPKSAAPAQSKADGSKSKLYLQIASGLGKGQRADSTRGPWVDCVHIVEMASGWGQTHQDGTHHGAAPHYHHIASPGYPSAHGHGRGRRLPALINDCCDQQRPFPRANG
jgi:hypothetical protein